MEEIEEEWRKIEGYDYEISNFGNLRSMDRITYSKEGVPRSRKGRFCSLESRTRDGYVKVGISKYGREKTIMLHRLVAQAFLPNPENLSEVNHKNAIKTDNRVENLEWVDRKTNELHSVELNLKFKGDFKRKFTNDQVISIRNEYASGNVSISSIARKYNADRRTVYYVISRRYYKDVA